MDIQSYMEQFDRTCEELGLNRYLGRAIVLSDLAIHYGGEFTFLHLGSLVGLPLAGILGGATLIVQLVAKDGIKKALKKAAYVSLAVAAPGPSATLLMGGLAAFRILAGEQRPRLEEPREERGEQVVIDNPAPPPEPERRPSRRERWEDFLDRLTRAINSI